MLNLVDYIIYANVAVIAFWIISLPLKRYTTFFSLNRYLYLFGLCFSLVYPLFHIDQAIIVSHAIHLPKFRITEEQVRLYSAIPESAGFSVWSFCKLLYLLGAGVFLCRLVIQFISLRKLYRHSTKQVIKSFPVRVVAMDIAPFSVWKTTFINPILHSKEDTINILEHENVHITQWHFIDILFCELLSVVFWINPVMWLLNKYVRENLEFITDKVVLDSGIDIKNYQYSLINVGLYNCNWPGNHFNSSTIKKRITMINAKRTSNFFLGIYIILVPLCCIALLSLTSANAGLKKALSNLPAGFRIAAQKGIPVKTEAIWQSDVSNVDDKKPVQKITSGLKRAAADSVRYTSEAYFVDNVGSSIRNLNDDLINHMQHLYVLTPGQFKAFNPKTFPKSTLIAIVITDSEKGRQLNEKISAQFQDNTAVVSNLKSLIRQVAAADTTSIH